VKAKKRPTKGQKVQAYRTAKHAVSGLPVMTAPVRPARSVSAPEIARLNAELL
jgi:hypothetical protein